MASERIEKLLAMQQKAEAQKRKAEQQLKAAKHKISIQRNKERTHRLCERGGHLEHYLPNPELLTDEDVFLLIDYFFSSPRVRELAEQMTASRRGEIPQSPKELTDAAVQRMPEPFVQSVTCDGNGDQSKRIERNDRNRRADSSQTQSRRIRPTRFASFSSTRAITFGYILINQGRLHNESLFFYNRTEKRTERVSR